MLRLNVVCVLWLTAAAVSLCGFEAPVVTKVDPPSWWLGSTYSPVRLLIRGEHLQGASVTAPAPLRVGNLRVNDLGTYAFVDLNLRPAATPGPVALTLSTGDGRALIPFTILPAIERSGRFQGFSAEDILYLIMPDRFANGDPQNDDPAVSHGIFNRKNPRAYHGGDFQGVIDHLAYLKDLGVTTVWMTPWYDNSNAIADRKAALPATAYHGYHTIDYYNVDEHLGDLTKLRELVDRAHALGLKVVQDQVANHTGPDHPWVTNSPLPDWFHGTAARHINEDWQTWDLMDPYASRARASTLDGWFANNLPDLNQSNPEVRKYEIQNALWWVAMAGIDGIRQDTLSYAPRDFWSEWRAALKREFPQLNVVGEVLEPDPALVAFFEGGNTRYDGIDTGIESLFDVSLFRAIRESFAKGGRIEAIPRSMAHDWLFRNPSRLVTLAGLHDFSRFMNEPGATPDGLKLAFTYLLTTRGIPMLYYGDEIGMPGGDDPDNRRDFPGGWAGDARDAFQAAGRTAVEQGVWQQFQKLAMLRRESPALTKGETILLHHAPQTLVYGRRWQDELVVTAFNNDARKSATITVSLTGLVNDDAPGGTWQDLVPSGATAAWQGKGELRIELPPRTAGVFRRQ